MSWKGYFAAVALLVPSMTAGAVVPLSFTAASVVASGATVLEGRLAAVEAYTPFGEPVPGWTFRLSGDGHLQVETEHRIAVGNMGAPRQPDETEGINTTGEWQGLQWTDDSYVFVRDFPGRPSPTVTLNPLSLRLDPPKDECVGPTTKWASMPVPECRNVKGSTAGRDGQGRIEVRIKGAFQVVIWGWILENETRSITTGQVDGQPVYDLPGPPIRPTDMTAALGVYPDGDLVLDVDAAGLSKLFVEGLRVSTDGVILAQDARDFLTRQGQGDLQMEGVTTLAVRPEQSRLAVAVVQHGSVEVVAPPAEPGAAAVAAQPAGGSGGAPWSLIAVSTLMVALVAVALLWWRRASAPLSRVARAMDLGRHEKALAAARSRRLPTGSSHVLQAIALIKAGRLDEAKGLLERSGPGLDPAARFFLLATIAATRHEDDVARRHLHACFRHDDAYRVEAAMNGVLRRILALDAREEAAGGKEAYT